MNIAVRKRWRYFNTIGFSHVIDLLSSEQKLIVGHNCFLGSQRSELFSQSHVKVEVQVDDTRSSIWSSGAQHEAGYDAFMKSCIFAQVCSRLGFDFNGFSPTEDLANSEKLQKHMNLLYLSLINGEIIELSSSN